MSNPTESNDASSPQEQFMRLFTQHEQGIRAYIRSAVHSWNDVDDVMQDVAVVAVRKFNADDASAGFRPWLFMIARYEILKFRRSKARDRLVLSEDVVATILDEWQKDLNEVSQRREALDSCLSKLPLARREIVIQSYAPGRTIGEIADQLGKKPAALRQLLRRIRLELFRCVELSLGEEGVTS